MSTRSDRIKALVEASGLSYQALEKRTGIKKSSLQRYASGATAKIPLEVMEKLAETFQVSQEYLMGRAEKDTPRPLTPGEESLLALFRKVPEDQQQLVLQMIRAALQKEN